MVVCEVCREYPAKATCRLCGRRVCIAHVTGEGLCTICSRSLCQLCGRRLSVTHCMICGRLACSDCLVQVDNVRRICVECARRMGVERARRWPGRAVILEYTRGARLLSIRYLEGGDTR
ncbi:MAG: hypothetical protein GSR86_03980 [Desulfurococcales archaeon]|nr:hypothetical protein [Desulfurococcales archaeon]